MKRNREDGDLFWFDAGRCLTWKYLLEPVIRSGTPRGRGTLLTSHTTLLELIAVEGRF